MTRAGSKADRYDAIVVGAGAGGLTVASGLAKAGRRVALIEADRIGGDCTNVGCIPSKALIEASRRVAALPVEERPAAAREALAEARHVRDEVRAHEEGWLAEVPGLEIVRGRARLVPGDAGLADVRVAGSEVVRHLRARTIVLATGSRPVVPPLPGLEGTDGPASAVLTNATAFDLASPPEHVGVMGGGVIGCELAFAFARLGSRVSIVEMAERLLPASEPDAARAVHARLEATGVEVHVGVRVAGYDGDERRVALAGADGEEAGGATSIERVDRFLVAVGRRPASRDLGLEEVGVATDGRGLIVVDRAYRTNVRNVHAIGDVIGGGFTHVANAQGRRLVRRLLLPLPLVREGDAPTVAFTEPEVGQIGPTLEALRARWPERALAVHRVALADTDRGRTLGLRDGFVQLVALRGSGRLLAATVVGPEAGEVLPLLSDAQRRGVSLWRLSRLQVAYPALTEAVKQAADAFVFASLPRLHREGAAWLRAWPTRWGAGA